MVSSIGLGYTGRMTLRLRHFVLALALLAGCPSTPVTPDAGDLVDAGTTDSPPDAPRPMDICDELGLDRVAFVTTGTGTAQGEIAADFTATTTTGSFTLSEAFTGCESYVFFVHLPGVTDAVFRTPPDRVFTDGARNVHYFYVSNDPDPAVRSTVLTEVQTSLEEGLGIFVPVEEHAFWRARVHYITDRATDIDGAIGDYLTDYLAYAAQASSAVAYDGRSLRPPAPAAFAIDRDQRFDPVDNLAPSVGETSTLNSAAWLGHFYNYRHDLEARLAAETGVSVVSLLDEVTTLRVFTETVTLPATAATADALEVDIVVDCTARNPFACSEWDRIASVSFCVDGEACTDRREVARWITPYWRRGRQHYAIDASPLLGLLREGGSQTFFVELGPDWERATEWDVEVSLRFRDAGAPRATEVVPAFRGGTFDATYNGRPAVHFTPPAGTTRVELVTILSGHGQVAGNNCAEWCDHRHTFTVNGTALPTIAHADEAIGSAFGCAAHAADGAIPGQWGNGFPMRAYWCPGLPVEALRTDITSLVTVGSDNMLDYAATFRTGDPAGGDIALSSYVVFYED